jgi:hypothetical protein
MMNGKKSLLSAGAQIAARNKRYVIWFYVLNLALALLGAAAFSQQANAILDHSLYAHKLLHGFDLVVFFEMISRPEFGSAKAVTVPALAFAGLFFLATMLLLPGVLLGYASDHRLPRAEFYRTCGQNWWRFLRVLLFFIIVAAPISGTLGAAQYTLVRAADQSSNERLPFFIQVACMGLIFVALTAIRIWFDLAQTHVVVGDRSKVRHSIAAAYRGTRHYRLRLLGVYLLIALSAGVISLAGMWLWIKIVPSASVLGAAIVGQAILLILLAARFWQRACAVAFYLQHMTAPMLETHPFPPSPWPAIPVVEAGGGPAPLPQT